MNGLLEAALSWLLTYCLHSTLLILGVWLATTLWSRSVRERDVLWKGALVGGLLTASVATFLPAPWSAAAEVTGPAGGSTDSAIRRPDPGGGAPEALAPSADRPRPWPGLNPAPGVDPASRMDSSGDSKAPHPSTLARNRSRTSPDVRGALRAADLASQDPPTRSPTSALGERAALVQRAWQGFLGPLAGHAGVGWVLWSSLTCGLLLTLVRGASSWCAVRRLLRTRTPLAVTEACAADLHAVLEDLRRRAGLRRRVRLSTCTGLRGPVSLWWGHPEVVLPTGLPHRLRGDEMGCLLAHEVAHLRRRDGLWLWIGLALRPLALIQPLNLLVLARLQRIAEYACDDWAAEVTGRRVAMASSLAEVARWIQHDRPRLPLPAMARGPSELRVRVERLLAPAVIGGRVRRAAFLCAAAIGLTALVPSVPTAPLPSGTTPEAPRSAATGPGMDAPASRAEVTGRPSTTGLPSTTGWPIGDATAKSPPILMQDVRRALRLLSREIDALQQEADSHEVSPELLARLADVRRRYEHLDHLHGLLRRWLATGRLPEEEVLSLLSPDSKESH